MSTGTLIVGIGNRYRGDDALGCFIADEIRARVDCDVMVHDGEPASLIDLWKDKKSVILIDAVSSGAEAGTIHRIDLQEQALPDKFRSYSTHAFGIAEAVELGRVLKKLPLAIVFYGIEGKSFAADTALSAPLREAVKILQGKIIEELKEEKFNA